MQSSRTFLLPSLLLAASCACLPGCLVAAGAAAGATAVAATGDDSVEVVLEHSVDEVYQRAVAVVDERGSTRDRVPEFYRFEGAVGGSHVWVNASPGKARGTTLLRVRARKLERTLPDLDLARDIAHRVVLDLAE